MEGERLAASVSYTDVIKRYSGQSEPGSRRAAPGDGLLPSGNVIWDTDQSTAQKAGPDHAATIEKVQKCLTLPVMQKLNARVDIATSRTPPPWRRST